MFVSCKSMYRAQNLRQGIVMKTSYKNPGFANGVRQFCGYQYFCYEILFYLVSSYSPILSNLLNQNLQNIKTSKRKLESFVQRYSFKFRA